MASAVSLQSVAPNAIQDASGNALNGHLVYVYARGTTSQVTVYADSGLTTPLTQPLTSGSGTALPGGLPGWVVGSQSIDLFDQTTNTTYHAEPVSGVDVANVNVNATAGGDAAPSMGVASTIAAPTLRDFASVKKFGAVGDGSTDDRPACASAVSALGGRGKVWFPGGSTYYMNSTGPLVAPNGSPGLVFAGDGKGTDTQRGTSTILLSSTCPRFLDPSSPGGVYSTCSGITIQDLCIDDNNILGNNHIIFGNWRAANVYAQLSFAWITIVRVSVINAPANNSSSGAWQCIALQLLAQNTDNQQISLQHVIIDHVFMYGGRVGIVCISNGTPNASFIPLVDYIEITNWYHDTMYVPNSAQHASSTWENLQIGANCQCGKHLYVANGVGKGSNDVGVEIDCPWFIRMVNVWIYGSYDQPFLCWNFQTPLDSSEQEWVLVDCHVVYDNTYQLAGTIGSAGCFAANAGGESPVAPLGAITYDRCVVHVEGTNTPSGGTSLNAFQVGNTTFTVGARKVTYRSCALRVDTVTIDGTSFASSIRMFYFGGTATDADSLPTGIVFEGTQECYVSATCQNQTHAFQFKLIDTNTVNQSIRSRGADVILNYSVTGQNSGNVSWLANFGSAAGTLYGDLPAVKVKRWAGGDTAPIAMAVNGTASLTVSPHLIEATDWDLKSMPSGTVLLSGAANQAPNTVCRNWKIPSGSSFTGGTLTPASGTNLMTTMQTANAVASRFPCAISINGGTISQVSFNGNTNYPTSGGVFQTNPYDSLTITFTSPRTDSTGVTVTNGSNSVADTHIAATDQGQPVSGTGIPAGTYVGTVTPGTSFLLSSSPIFQINVNANNNGTSVTVGSTPTVAYQPLHA